MLTLFKWVLELDFYKPQLLIFIAGKTVSESELQNLFKPYFQDFMFAFTELSNKRVAKPELDLSKKNETFFCINISLKS